MQPALSTRNRRLFNRRPSLLWKIRKVVQKYSIIIAFLPRHHKPQLLTPNRAARHSHASETGHSIARPTACGSRVPPQRTLALGTPRCPAHTMQKGPFPEGKEPLLHCLNSQSRSDELQNCHLSSVAAASADLDDAGVAAVAVSVLGADLINSFFATSSLVM